MQSIPLITQPNVCNDQKIMAPNKGLPFENSKAVETINELFSLFYYASSSSTIQTSEQENAYNALQARIAESQRRSREAAKLAQQQVDAARAQGISSMKERNQGRGRERDPNDTWATQEGGGTSIPLNASVTITWSVLLGVQSFNTPLSSYIKKYKYTKVGTGSTARLPKWNGTLAKLQYDHLYPYMTTRNDFTKAEAISHGFMRNVGSTGGPNLSGVSNSFDKDLMTAFKNYVITESGNWKGLFGTTTTTDNKCTFIPKNKSDKRLGVPSQKNKKKSESTFFETMSNSNCFPSGPDQSDAAKWENRADYFSRKKSKKYYINNAVTVSQTGRTEGWLGPMQKNYFCPLTSSIDPQKICVMVGNNPEKWNANQSAMEWGKMDVTVKNNDNTLIYQIVVSPNFTSLSSSNKKVTINTLLKIGDEILIGPDTTHSLSDNSDISLDLGPSISAETDAVTILGQIMETTANFGHRYNVGFIDLMDNYIRIPLNAPQYYYNTDPTMSDGPVTLDKAYTSPFNGIHAMRFSFPLKGKETNRILSATKSGNVDPASFFVGRELYENDRVIEFDISQPDSSFVGRPFLLQIKNNMIDQQAKGNQINFGTQSKPKYHNFIAVLVVATGSIGLIPHTSISMSSRMIDKTEIWEQTAGLEGYKVRRELAHITSKKGKGDQLQEFSGTMDNGGYTGQIYKSGEEIATVKGRGKKRSAIITEQPIIDPNDGRVMLGNDTPSAIRAMVITLFADNDINPRCLAGYMPKEGFYVIASRGKDNWPSPMLEGGRKKTRKKKRRKLKTNKKRRHKKKTRKYIKKKNNTRRKS